jgi:hypothetical protein
LVIGEKGVSKGRRTIAGPRRRWVDNIKMDLGEIGWGSIHWIGLAQDRKHLRALVKEIMNLGFA